MTASALPLVLTPITSGLYSHAIAAILAFASTPLPAPRVERRESLGMIKY